MGWFAVLVREGERLFLKDSQFCSLQNNQQRSLPLQDVAVVVLETHQATVTSALLSAMADHGIALITCDDKHLPNGVLLPSQQHHRQTQQVGLQLEWSEPFKKRCWQRLIIQKIENQAQNLDDLGDEDGAEQLLVYARDVGSGDPTNREAVAAKAYWTRFFEDETFTRQGSGVLSAALNYGYAVIRACIARALVAAGLLPCLGVHHASQLNPWNLADDLLEPFRPWVDAHVKALPDLVETETLTPEHRTLLANLVNAACMLDDETLTLLSACEIVVESLVRASKAKDPSLLQSIVI